MADVKQRFAELGKLPYRDQAIWMLNGRWNDLKSEAETFWTVVNKFIELDEKKGAEGNELDEFNSHRLLEHFDSTLTVIKMREAMREIDQDANGCMSCIEYLIWRYKSSVEECVNFPQGDNAEAVAAATALLKQVQSQLEAVEEAQAATAQAIIDLGEKERQSAIAEKENAAAVVELKAQEDAYNGKIAELEAKSTDTSIGVVTRNKAANELSQLKAEDPLPLRKAKITQEAAVRLVQKAQAATAAAKAETEAKKAEQEAAEAAVRLLQKAQREAAAAKADAERRQVELEQSKVELEGKMVEAETALARAKQGGGGRGALWFGGRTLYHADESLARAKQKFDHSKPFQFEE